MNRIPAIAPPARPIHIKARSVIFSSLYGLAIAITFTSPAFADEGDPTEELTTVLENARTWIVGIAGVLVAVMLTIAGIRYLLGGGNPSETEKAKTALQAAAIGFAIVILAPILVEILKGILGAS